MNRPNRSALFVAGVVFASAGFGSGCSGSDGANASASDAASRDDVAQAAAEFANATCAVVESAEQRYGDIDVSLRGATPGSEDYRIAVVEFLEAVGEMVDGFGDVNSTVELVGTDAETFQSKYGEAMTYSRDRVDEYIAALSVADAPVVDLNEVYDDVLVKVEYTSTITGTAVQQAMRECSINESAGTADTDEAS